MAREAMQACVSRFGDRSADDKLMDLMKEEYRLFKLVERQLCLGEVRRLFKDIDDFLSTAATIMNRRKSRAGRSLENHAEYLLREAGIPFDVRSDVEGKPDILIPGKAEYADRSYPTSKLFMVGVKTTCKDRWRQILNEARRIEEKHLLTIQEGISSTQMEQMHDAQVSLVVPKRLHRRYPDSNAQILNIEEFVQIVQEALADS